MGDPHGIGPEVLLKSLHFAMERFPIAARIFGSRNYLTNLQLDLDITLDPEAVQISDVGDYPYPPRWGTTDAGAGAFAVACLRSAVQHCRDQDSPLLVTAPISKKSAVLSNTFHSPGQTEYIASFFPDVEPAMAFFSEQLRVLLVTVHIPLRGVFAALNTDLLVRKTILFHKALQKLGIASPRIAVCGLNPHASEEGLFGNEEKTILEPAIQTLTDSLQNGRITGPLPADTAFHRAVGGEFDGVVAQYHDQGLIPVKLLAFDSAVNTTLGLPLIRTSPDHGTAFDIAGQGKADSGSMQAALEIGLRLAKS